ncbi:MAG: hypothetical protein MUF22_09495 [Chitinispirillaceae bacterium]|jgi:hypothetical protein|nr:hypothetical protein [Chitinispirillaceae bacterium]
MKKLLVVFTLLISFFLIAGCGPSDKVFADAEKRISALSTKGVPDHALSPAKVSLYQARESKKRGSAGEANKAVKQLKIELASAESLYRDKIITLKPGTDSLRSVLQNRRADYTGMQLAKLDSLIAVVDSFIKIDWMLQANTKAKELIDFLPSLTADSERSKELRQVIPGEWVCTNKTTSTENKAINAVEKKIFTFKKDGSAVLSESKKGQSGPYLKEDWDFLSTGTWDVNGDTICLFINRFAIKKQMFERLYIKGDEKTWKKEPQPTYDSAITDGSQNRYITFADLKIDFEQKKKF